MIANYRPVLLVLTAGLVLTHQGDSKAQSPPKLRQHPHRFTQDLGKRNGERVTTLEKTIPHYDPIRPALKGVRANEYAQQEDQRTTLIKRMLAVQTFVRKHVPSELAAKQPSSNELFQKLKVAYATAPEGLRVDLQNMLIPALVEIPLTGGVKAYVWSYRRLDGDDKNWGPPIEANPNDILFIPMMNLLSRDEMQANSYPALPLNNKVPSGSGTDGFTNAPHDFDVTNLHTHGLNVSPNYPSDDIFREVRPYQLKFYIYYIPEDHPAGTFFYHPHHHGSVATQVAGGMAGPLTIRDDSKGLDALGVKNHWQESILMFQQLGLFKNVETQNYFVRPDFFALKDMDAWTDSNPDWVFNCKNERLPLATIAKVMLDGTKVQDRGISTWVSGTLNAELLTDKPLKRGECHRLRLIHAGIEANINFQLGVHIDRLTGDEVSPPTLQVIARDGIPLQKPYFITPDHPLILSPGNRADVLVGFDETALGAGDFVFPVYGGDDPCNPLKVATLKANLDGVGTPPAFVTDAEALRIYSNTATAPATTPEANVPTLDTDGDGVDDPVTIPLQPLTVAFADAQVDIHGNFTVGTFNMNKAPFHSNAEIPFVLGQVREIQMEILPADPMKPNLVVDAHPFHIHVNSFKVAAPVDDTEAEDRRKQGLPDTEFWTDTLLVERSLKPKSITVMMPFKHWTGRFVAHCHILDHEDGGMMVPVRIDPPTYAFPVLPLPILMAMEWFPSNSLAALTTQWPAGAQWSWDDASAPNCSIVVFMPEVDGDACSHCQDAVKAVSALREQAGLVPFRLIVVHGGGPKTAPDRAVLNLKEGDILCIDPELRVFEGLGLIDGTPEIKDGLLTFSDPFKSQSRKLIHPEDAMHGLVIVSQGGRIESFRRGFTAFTETKQLLAEVATASENDIVKYKERLEAAVKNAPPSGTIPYKAMIEKAVERKSAKKKKD